MESYVIGFTGEVKSNFKKRFCSSRTVSKTTNTTCVLVYSHSSFFSTYRLLVCWVCGGGGGVGGGRCGGKSLKRLCNTG